MEIALILDRFDPNHGGLEHWAFQLAAWLTARGHRVHIVAALCAHESARPGLTLHPLGRKESRMAFGLAVEQHLRSLEMDIVHDLGSGWYFDLLQPQFGSRLADARQNLLSFPFLKRWKYRMARSERRRLRDARALEERQYAAPGGKIIAVSQMTRADLQHFHAVPSDRLTVIHNGVDTERFHPQIENDRRTKIRNQLGIEEKIVLLSTAHNFRLKGVDTLLKALAKMRDTSFHALIVGRGPVEEYQRMAGRLRVQRQVTFCGFVEDIRDYYAASDIHVHPSFYDPCSLSVLEAMASGLPVITTRFNGASELMKEGVNGMVLRDPADGSKLAEALRRLQDRTLRTRMGQAAREAALLNTANRCFELILESYHEVLKHGQGRESRAWSQKT